MDPNLQALAEAPLDDFKRTNALWRPEGVKKAKREPRVKQTAEFDPNRITMKEVNRRKDRALGDKMRSVLAYYATTEVPFERIAEHTGLPLERVISDMKWLGREA